MGSWRNEIRNLHWLWLQKYICVSNSLPPSSPSHEHVSYGQDKWLLHCPFCSCDLNTYSSESNHLLRSTNQTESFCHLIFSHGLWIKPKLHLAYKEVPGPTFLSFRCLSLVLMKWKHRLPPPPSYLGPCDVETQTSSLLLKLAIQLSASGLLCLLPVFCPECASLWKAISYFTLGFLLRGQYYTCLPWLLFFLGDFPVASFFITKGYHYFLLYSF